MQDASLQESMGPISIAARRTSVSTDNGIIMARRALLRAMKANKEGKKVPGLTPESQRVRSCAIVLPKTVKFAEGAKHGLFCELGTDRSRSELQILSVAPRKPGSVAPYRAVEEVDTGFHQ